MYYRGILICAAAILASPFVKKTHPAYFCYLALLCASVVLSKFNYTPTFGTPNYYEGFFVIAAYLVFGMYGHFPERAARWSVYIVGLMGLMQLVSGCYFDLAPIHFFMPKNIAFDCEPWPIYSTLGNGNHLGLFCALLLPFFLAKRQPLPSIVLVLLLIGSQSRGAWISVIITTLIQFRKQWKAVLIAVVLCLIPVYPRVVDGLRGLHWPLKDSDISGRAFIWSQTIPMLKHHWVTGSGPGVYALNFPQHSRGMYPATIVDRPHNMYLNVWYSAGFLSLLACAWVVADFFGERKSIALTMGVLGFLIAGLFTDSVVSVTPYFMLMLSEGLQCGHSKRLRGEY